MHTIANTSLKTDRIFVAGHAGLVGSAVLRKLQSTGCENLLTASFEELDLRDQKATRQFFEETRPQHVVLAAAKVGGIYANNTYPAEFIHDNLAIEINVIDAAYRSGVDRLIFLGSSCIYPRECPQPIKEEYLLTGPLEATNRPYALAKIAGVEMCWAYNRQYKTRFVAVMPTNLYGPGDNFDLQNSHVIPAMMRKMHEAKIAGASHVDLWGTGNPRREFLYSDDLAAAIVHLLELPDDIYNILTTSEEMTPLLNIGYGEDVTIKELAELIRNVVGFSGEIRWDVSQPDGTPQKLLDISRITSLGWEPTVPLHEGLSMVYEAFLTRRGKS